MPNGSLVVAHVELRESNDRDNPRALVQGLSPAWSLTGEVYERHGTWDGAAQRRNEREPDTCGCVHEHILRALPALEPFARLHLSAPDGTPMHALENGWYWYQQGDEAKVCSTLRVSSVPAGLDRPRFAAFVELQRPRWEREALEARELLQALVDDDRNP